jgi:hypothetical protein
LSINKERIDINILIFRTVSIEKLDIVLDQCRSNWPKDHLVVISSPNRYSELIGDHRISKVITLSAGQNGFSQQLNLKSKFKALVIPINNQYGSGYGNVFSAGISCAAEKYYLMPYATRLNQVSITTLKFYQTMERILLSLSLPIAHIITKLVVNSNDAKC